MKGKVHAHKRIIKGVGGRDRTGAGDTRARRWT